MLEDADALDADPVLLRSATHHGESTTVTCPVCTKGTLTNLNYVFGDQLGQFSGRIKSTAELEEMQNEYGEFTVRCRRGGRRLVPSPSRYVEIM